MLKLLLALCLTLVALPALAQDVVAVGFTQDGTVFVAGRPGGDDETPEAYLLFDARSGEQQEEELDPEQFKAWAVSHPLAPLRTGPQSPDGKLRLEAAKGGRWKDGRFEVAGATCTWTGDDSSPEVKVPPPTRVSFTVKAGKRRWPGADFRFEHTNVEQRVEPVWSPEGRRVAYLVHVGSACGMGVSDFQLAFGSAQGPRVQVLGGVGTSPEALEKAQAALEAAGLAPTGTGEAKGAHPSTVIFAARGFEAEAKKAAAALPGARVDKLTWKPGYELVVVLGGK